MPKSKRSVTEVYDMLKEVGSAKERLERAGRRDGAGPLDIEGFFRESHDYIAVLRECIGFLSEEIEITYRESEHTEPMRG